MHTETIAIPFFVRATLHRLYLFNTGGFSAGRRCSFPPPALTAERLAVSHLTSLCHRSFPIFSEIIRGTQPIVLGETAAPWEMPTITRYAWPDVGPDQSLHALAGKHQVHTALRGIRLRCKHGLELSQERIQHALIQRTTELLMIKKGKVFNILLALRILLSVP